MTVTAEIKRLKTAVSPVPWSQIISLTSIQVFIFSLAILFLEATLFSTLLFTHTYLIAMQSIAFALLGIGLGSLFAARLNKQMLISWVPWVMIGSAFSIVALFINIAIFPQTVTYSPFMILPFVLGSIIISHAFSKGDTGSLYFFDLAGAATGTILFVILLPLWREEGNLIFLALLMVIMASLHLRPSKIIKWSLLGIQAVLILLLLLNGLTNTLNLSNLTRCPSSGAPQKVFCRLDGRQDGSHIVVSKGNSAARIDILSLYSQKYGHNRLWVNFNGMMADAISNSPLESSQGDLRIPGNLTSNPDILIIGTAGNGIIRPARLLAGDQGTVDGLEINAGLASLMTGPLKQASGNVYDYLDRLFITDARTYLNTQDKTYDVMTLLNTYTGLLQHSLGAPEYLHTVEAMDSYLAHLNPNGFLIFEIRDVSDFTRAAGLRIVNALAEAYANQTGDAQVQDNFYVYEFYPQNQSLIRSNNYTMILFKNSSFTEGDIGYLNNWIDAHNEANKAPRANRLYVPGAASNHDYGRFITATATDRANFFTDGSWITTPTTDDRPFLADAQPGFQEAFQHVRGTAVIVLLTVCILLGSLWRGKSAQMKAKLIPYWVYFAATGFGYLLLEVALIQWLQIFTGLPAYTFIFVLGALLLFSGLGGYISRSWTASQVFPAFVGLLLLIAAYSFWLQPIMMQLQTASLLWNSIVVALLLLPLGFMMGIPLPFGLRLLRHYFSEADIPLSYGVNSLFATLGSSVAILVALYAGFSMVFTLGAFAYLCAFIALIFLRPHHKSILTPVSSFS